MEVITASAVLVVTLGTFLGAMYAARSMLLNARQRLDAESLAFDWSIEVFNTVNFGAIRLATNLPARPTPASCSLPPGSEIRVGIFPNTGTAVPYKWDIEVRVKRARYHGSPPANPGNDVVMRVTRYAVNRN